MRIIEQFLSIQGEGTHIGVPSIFIRFAGCNLNCGFCDTKYSWGEKGTLTWRDAVKFIRENPLYNHIVFTGGEPLIEENQQLVLAILENTMTPDSRITVETNGTILPDKELLAIMRRNGLWSISPKLQYIDVNEIGMYSEEYDVNIFRAFDLKEDRQWKFVITDLKEDFEKIITLMRNGTIHADIDHPIIVQPNGNTKDYNNACMKLAEYVIKNNFVEFKVLPQFHKICWGNKRGI